MEGNIFIEELNKTLQIEFDEYEYFVFEHISAGWKPKDIRNMLDISYSEYNEIFAKIKTTIRRFYDNECYPRKVPVC
jgi:hypothetical protein